MKWAELFDKHHPPALQDISRFVHNERWDELCLWVEKNYAVSPQISYSACSMQKGWNVKYKKSSKSLCTLYPMEGYFIALLVIGAKEEPEAEQILPTCTEYLQKLFEKTPYSAGGRWLMIELNSPAILADVFKLIQIRVKPKANKAKLD